MNLAQAQQVWSSQRISPMTRDQIQDVIQKSTASAGREMWTTLLMTSGIILLAIFNFYGQYVLNGDPLLIASLRFFMVLAVVPIQVFVWKGLRKRYHDRVNSQFDQKKWLTMTVADLKQQVEHPGDWKILLFCFVMTGVLAFTKYLDVQAGNDSVTESMAIVAVFVAFVAFIWLGRWHYREQFLIPRYDRFRGILSEME